MFDWLVDSLYKIQPIALWNPCTSHAAKDLFLESGLVPSWKKFSGYKMSVLPPSPKMNVHGCEHQKGQKLYLKSEEKKWHEMKWNEIYSF